MKDRRGYTRKEAVTTIQEWMRHRGMTKQTELVSWLSSHGITLSPQYVNDIFHGKRAPGKKFIEAFKEITGIQLVVGLVEVER